MSRLTAIFLFTLFCLAGYAEETLDPAEFVQNEDSARIMKNIPLNEAVELFDSADVLVATDTLSVVEVPDLTESKPVFKPDPNRTIWMGALIPGFGQIANRKYWKLPIVYGGFVGLGYAINWNHSRYTAYKNGYIDISDNDPNTNYHLKLLPRGYTLDTFPGGEATFKNRLRTGMDTFHQYRDLSILITIGYYALVLLDAYVDAQLYDFNISPDLVLNVNPTRFEYNSNINNRASAFGVEGSIRF